MRLSRGLRLAGGMSLAAAGAALALGWARKNLVVVTVSGTSMLPTLQDGDRVLVRRRPLAQVRQGDVVVLEPPLDGPYLPGPAGPDGRIWNVKRAAALPGDELPPGIPNAPNSFIAPGTPAASGGTDASGSTAEDVPPREVRAVPPGALAVLGDNPAADRGDLDPPVVRTAIGVRRQLKNREPGPGQRSHGQGRFLQGPPHTGPPHVQEGRQDSR